MPHELSLTETICLKDTRKVARDYTVKYQWRVLQLLPRAERPSYAGLRVDVLERADGELMIRYQGKAVDHQEGPLPSSALWGEGTGHSPGAEGRDAGGEQTTSHLDEDQQKILAALESPVEKRARVKRAAIEGRTGKAKPLRHQLHRSPPATQQARWEVVQKARKQGLSLRAIAKNLGMARDTVGKYLKAESPPTKKLSAKERAQAEALAASSMATN